MDRATIVTTQQALLFSLSVVVVVGGGNLVLARSFGATQSALGGVASIVWLMQNVSSQPGKLGRFVGRETDKDRRADRETLVGGRLRLEMRHIARLAAWSIGRAGGHARSARATNQ